MKHALITTATAALLLASQGAFAQPQNRGDGPGAGAQSPGPGASPGSGVGPGNSGDAPGRSGPSANPSAPPAQPGPAGTPRAEQQQQRPAQQQAQPQGQQQKSQQRAEQKADPKPEQKSQQKAEQKADPKPEQKAQQKAEQKKAEQKSEQKGETQRTGESKQPTTTPRADAQGKTTGKDAEQNRAARDGKADSKADAKDTARKDADRAKDQNRNDTAQGKSDDKSADKGHGDRMTGNQDLRQARERLDTQERVRLHDAFDRRAAKTNIRVNVNIGSRVPRNVRLVRVPQTVITFFPYYREYSYFVVDERVYIVNPRSYEVVDIIDEGYGRGQPSQQQARLTLTESQMILVREAVVDADVRPESLRLRLALGAEIPRDVELHRFPSRVLDNVRELERYRFVLVEDQIVIVKPDDRSIALVIDRS